MKIAVIGIGCRYPGANSAHEFFENVLTGRRGFRQMPNERWHTDDYYHPDKDHPDTTYCKKAALVEGFEFNPADFLIPRSTYLATDTAQWMTLKVAQEALQDAGIDPEKNQNTGVIIGNTLTGEVSRASSMRHRWPYVKRIFSELLDNLSITGMEKELVLVKVEERYKAPFPPVNEDNLAGSLSNTIAGRICNYFDFKGGGFSTDGACSSSLLAINQACIGLLNRNCDLALAGGVDISLDPFELVGFAKVGALSDTDINVYDQFSNGFIPGEGCGIVVLQRYEDAIAQGKSVYAVVNGIGISSDGKGGITAPSVSGQSLAVSRAYSMAEYNFSDVELIEGHGTGTPTGDKVELTTFVESKELNNPEESHRCGVGSIKSNIGHTKAAAGVAGFIKTLMSVCYGILPPTQGIRTPNEQFKRSEYLYPLLSGGNWQSADTSRKAAVSSAGFGGINTHITLSSDEKIKSRASDGEGERYLSLLSSNQSSEVFFIGAESSGDLGEQLATLLDAAKRISMAELPDMSNCCAQSFSSMRLRLALVASTPEQLVDKLEQVVEHLSSVSSDQDAELIDTANSIFLRSGMHQPRIAYLFPGQASQSVNMGRRVKERCKTVSRFWSNCDELLKSNLGKNLSELVFRDNEAATQEDQKRWMDQLNQTEITQPAVTVASLASVAYLRELGLRPDLAIGHSLGEYSALCSAGVLSVEQTLKLVALRGNAMAESGDQPGAMLSINASVEVVKELISDIDGEIVISNMNSHSQIIVSGDVAAIEIATKKCQSAEISATLLPVSNAFHSKLMLSASQRMEEELKDYSFSRMRHLVITPTTGDFLSDNISFPELLKNQILEAVNFVDAIETAANENYDVFVEVGPGSVLTGLTKNILSNQDVLVCASDIGDRGQHAEGLNQLAAYLFACGEPLNKQKLFEGRFFRPFELPYKKSFIPSPCETKVPPLEIGVKDGSSLGAGLKLDLEDLQNLSIAIPQKTSEQGVDEGPDAILEMLRTQIIKDFGYPEEMLTAGAQLQDNLGLDSLKSVELAHEIMGAVGVKADVSHMQNASLQELADYIYQLKSGEVPESVENDQTVLDLVMPEWVNAFNINAVPQTLEKNLEDKLSGQLLLIYECEDELVAEIEKKFTNLGIQFQSISASEKSIPDIEYNGCIFLLNKPQPLSSWLATDIQSVQARMERPHLLLSVAAQLANNQTDHQKYFALVAAQGATLWGSAEPQSEIFAEAGAGFLKTLHLEHSEIQSCCINMDYLLEPCLQADLIIDELTYGEGYVDVAFNADKGREIAEYQPTVISQLPRVKKPLQKDDVVLITGGGKGITAECALTLANSVGVKLALVGSSQRSLNLDDSDELSLNLKRFSDAGIEYKYYACDVLDQEQVQNLILQVEKELGTVKSIIHAAGVNGLQKIDSAEWTQFERVLKPKIEGLVNLVTSVKLRKLKSLMVFSSVIASSGMAGNAEYAYANEWMNQLLRRIQTHHPKISCKAFGFSVWSDVGMATRLNSVDLLRNMGIGAIPVETGCEMFRQLTEKSWPDSQLIISSRMGSLNTLRFSQSTLPKKRFIENILHWQPKIELVSEVFLEPKKDLYLADHVYEGSFLFPAVMGIEAMTQCAQACRTSDNVELELLPELLNLKFSRAIIVPPEGRNIRIYVQLGAPQADGEQRAQIAIRSSVTHYGQDYFSAECVWKPVPEKVKHIEKLTQEYLELEPHNDLYGKILFQGPMFQNIKAYRELSSIHCVVDIDLPIVNQLFSDNDDEYSVFFGAAEVRDTFLHAVQLCVPEHRILPISMERVFYRGYEGKDGKGKIVTLLAVERERTDNEFLYDLEVYDESGYCVELITGFRCRIMGEYDDKDNLELIFRAHEQSKIKKENVTELA